MIELLNVIAAILAIMTSGYLFVLASKAAGELKTSLLLIACGIVIGMGIHSIAELLEAYNLIEIELLTTIMPIFVSLGALLLFIGAFILYRVVKTGGGA